jgi:hypothetical protein
MMEWQRRTGKFQKAHHLLHVKKLPNVFDVDGETVMLVGISQELNDCPKHMVVGGKVYKYHSHLSESSFGWVDWVDFESFCLRHKKYRAVFVNTVDDCEYLKCTLTSNEDGVQDVLQAGSQYRDLIGWE